MSETFAERFPAAAANKPSAEDLDAHAAEQKMRTVEPVAQSFANGDVVSEVTTAVPTTEEIAKTADDLGIAGEQKAELVADSERVNAKPEPTKEQLQKLADEFKQKFGSHNGLRTLPNGSIVVEVVIDVDLAGSLIAWAEGAGENVSDYIQKQVGEALLSYMGG